MHQSITPSLSQTIWLRWASRQFLSLPVSFGYSLSSEAVVMRQLRRWKRLWWRSLTQLHKRTSMGCSRSCLNGTTSALQPEKITSKETRVLCVYYQQKCSGVRPLPLNECLRNDTKQSDDDSPVMLELWGMLSIPSLPLLPVPLWPRVVAPERVLSMGQIELFDI